MQLFELNLGLELKDTKENNKRVSDAIKKKQMATYQPTWDEVWVTGYITTTGRHKAGIFQTKLTSTDKERLSQVKEAIDSGELGAGVEDLKKFTKSHALRLYQELKELRRADIIADMVKNCPSNYYLVDNIEMLNQVVVELANENEIGLDTETTGVDYKDRTVGISMSLRGANKHYYIPYGHLTGEKQLDRAVVMEKLKPQLERPDLRCVLHNSKFDMHMLIKDGITLGNVYMDTMVAQAILNENEASYALKNLANVYGKYFGYEDKSMTYEELFGRGGFENTPLDIGTVYACKDTHLTLLLSIWQRDMMDKQPALHNVYFGIEQPTTPICIHMEQTGFLIDMEFAKEYADELRADISKLEAKLVETFGDINVNSNQQLAVALYDNMGLTDESGKRSVDKSALKRLAPKCEAVATLLEYRALNKLLSTYIEPLPQLVWDDGRLHGSFNQTGTVTGRFASRNPNLQNLPQKARHMIVAPKGKLIMGGDWSQQEPRILSHVSKDENLQHPYLTGQDLYSTLASKTFNKPLEECGDGSKYRKMMKFGLLSVMYGTSMFTLAEQLGITVDEAQKFISDFYEAYPKVAKFIKATNAEADKNGFVQTLDGRKRRFIGHQQVAKQYHAICDVIIKQLGAMPENIWQEKRLSRDLKQAYWKVAGAYGRVSRQSVNAIIQGSSADMTKKTMQALYKWIEDKPDFVILGTVHDEVLLEVPDTITPAEVQEFVDIMIKTCVYDVPMKTDVEMAKRWGQGVPLKAWWQKGHDNFDDRGFVKHE